MLNNLHYYYLQKKKFKYLSLNVTCLLRKGFPLIFIYKVTFYVKNLVFILLMTAASCFGLVFVWIVSLLMVALVMFVFKRSRRYSLLTGLVMIVLVFDKLTFAPLTLVSRPGINSVTSPSFHCDLGNLST